MDNVKILLSENEIPRKWYNLAADLPTPDAAAARPGRQAGPAGDAGAGLPDEPHRAGGQHRALDRHPRRGPRHPLPLAAVAAPARRLPGEAPEDAGADLLQGRERQPGRQPQAQHRRAAGLVQQAVRHQAADHRDRRRPVGQRPGLRLQPDRPGVQGLHGAHQLRPEAVPQADDAGLGRQLHRQPSKRDQRRPRRSWPACPTRPGSLGIAISEAIEAAVTDPTGKTRYSLGSVLNHVLLHQTIIGLEAKKQLKKAGEKLPDVVIGCAGGGSNFAGLAFPFAPTRSTAPRSRSSRSSRRPARR